MGQVNIRGLVNTTYLREGERATVERTATIDELAERGFIAIDSAGRRDDVPGGATAPPKSGRGATRANWAEWLELNGVDVDPGDTKNDLIEKWMGRAVQG